MKNPLRVFALSILILLSSFARAQAPAQPPSPAPAQKTKERIPVKVNIGFGLGRYRLFDVYGKDQNADIYGLPLSIEGVVEKPTLEKYQNKVPEPYRKAVTSLGEAAVSHVYIPEVIYATPLQDHREAYGATWAFIPRLSVGGDFLRLGVEGGLTLTYLYFRDDRYQEPVHFIRPGARGGVFGQIGFFSRNVILQVGHQWDAFVPQKFFSDEQKTWHWQDDYVMLHLRFPLIIEAEI